MTTRNITKHQFSVNTTIDGNRIEGALQDVQDRFNSLQFKDVDAWYENRFHFATTPALITTQAADFVTYTPWVYIDRSKMPNDIDGEAPNNPFRFKGCGRLDPEDGTPDFNETNFYDMAWFWTTTKFFDVPTILNDFTIFGLFDSIFTQPPGTQQDGVWYFNNIFRNRLTEIFTEDVQLWIIVDNPLNLGDTLVRNSEIHMWGASAGSFIMSGDLENPPAQLANGEPAWASSSTRHNGAAFRVQNLNIPVFAGSRVRFVIGLPAFKRESGDDITTLDGSADAPFNEDAFWTDSTLPPWANNIWTMNISVFEPLRKYDE